MPPTLGGLIRVLLVDDNPNVIATTRLILLTSEDIEVVGEAGDGEKSLEAVQRLRPDVVIMDGRMPKMDGAEATRRILREFPETKVVALSIGDDSELIRRMESAGATNTVFKGAGPEELSRAIRAAIKPVSSGGRREK